eukprot:gene2247-17854_t
MFIAITVYGRWAFPYFIDSPDIDQISATKRGGIRLTDESGIITSPGYPNGYPNSIAFIWLINTTESKYVELTFVDFDVEPYRDCSADYVKIRNKKPTHGNFKDVPQIATKRGGIRLTDESGIITSPGYPNGYPNSIAFIWLINTTESKYVELTFVDFDVEPYRDCSADYVKIRNKKPTHGNFKDVPQIGPYCNDKKPPKIVISSSNLMAIVFISDSSLSYRGFKATYRSLDKKACGEVKKKNFDLIMTPGFPWTYPREGDCLWLINVQEGKYVRLEFLAFELEFNAQLCMDEIFVWDGKTELSPLLHSGCRFKPPVLFSSSNHLRIKFTSRGYHRSHGFKAFYTTTTTKGCGGEFLLPNGTFTSPRFNLEAGYTYPAYSNCLWTVTAPEGHVVSFKFVIFDVLAGSTGFCDEDYVQIFDGATSQTNPIGKYCNIEKPNVISSSGNSLSMKFLTNARKSGKGFKVQYRTHKTGCKDPLGMEDGRIPSFKVTASSFLRESPHFRPDSGRLNGPHTWCTQPQVNNRVGEFIQVDLGSPTLLTGFATQGYMMAGTRQSYYVTRYKVLYSQEDGRFFKTYAAPSKKAENDKQKIFTGNTDSIGIIRNDLEHPVVARMFRIVPLGYVHGKKRTICTKIEVYGCKFYFGDGKMFQALDGQILYSGRISSPKESHWVLSPPTFNRNSVLYVMPLYFNIDCEKANLRIEDGVQNNTYCGSNKPPPFHIYSGNQQLTVSLRRKDGSLEGQRFGLQYFVEYLGSGRVLRAPQGIVRATRGSRSLNMDAYNTSKSTWIILLPKKQKVAAKFTRLQLDGENNGKCEEFVQIKDGVFGSSATLGNFCRGAPEKAFVTSGNAMRVEFTSNVKSERQKRDVPAATVSFEIAYTNVEETDAPSPGKLAFLMHDPPSTPRPKDKSGTNASYHGSNRINTAVIVLLMFIIQILLPT